MKLDTSHMRYLTADDFRVLQAVELGSRNHELVPTQIIHSVGGLKAPSATNRSLGDLAKLKLVARLRNAKYDGWRLMHTGFDYLALKTMLNRNTIYSVGTTIGVGKESDIYSVSDPDGVQKVLKIHRLGRTSFKTVKNNRDYLKNRNTSNWMYLSRLAAEKEYEFMTILHNNGFIVPTPYDYSRHCVLMEWIQGYPMKHMKKYPTYKKLYSELMKFIVKLANHGLIHCDFNEFNIIIRSEPRNGYDFVVIDFPQCVSIDHPDAKFYFDRDVEGIRAFFERKFAYSPGHDPTMFDTEGYGEGYRYGYPNFKRDVKREADLDAQVKASGWSSNKNKESRDLENAVQGMRGLSLNEERDDDEDDRSEVEEYDEEDEDDDEDDYDDEDIPDESEEETNEDNEKIIKAISEGNKNLKIDKLGNYILEE
ncbi:hypothetical protein RJF_2648 [Candidozyma auris]|nr:hypothetical protein QG37_07747 [[Candida] auris]